MLDESSLSPRSFGMLQRWGGIVMNTRERRDTTRPEIWRRLLACLMAGLFVVQPIIQASPACSILALISGQGACCCAKPSKVQAPSCCSTADISRDASGTSLSSPVKRCGCEVRAPGPLPALPRESGARSVDGDSDRCLDRWIGSGALASASTPILEWASPPGEASVALLDGVHPFSRASAPSLARGARGLLALICSARC